jgi:hypothetical protein
MDYINWFGVEPNAGQESFHKALSERLEAMDGKCPEARIMSSQTELAQWFRSASIAAGVNARSKG